MRLTRKIILVSSAATLAVALAAAGLAAVGAYRPALLAFAAHHHDAIAPADSLRRVVADELARQDEDIALYTNAMAMDSASATFRSRLAAIYLQRGRQTGDFADVRRADSLARSSLARRTPHNDEAWVTLASSLLSQHRFVEANRVARQLVAGDPSSTSHRALLGETQLELGDYEGARESFDAIQGFGGSLSTIPRLARWRELQGDTAYARRLLRLARTAAERRADLPREQRAWFCLRLGDFDLRHGHPLRAEESLRAGLALLPTDYRLLSAMARLEATYGHWDRVIAYGNASIASVLDPATLGLVADAYRALGDSAHVREYESTLRVAVSLQPGGYHRAYALYLIDHDQDVADILARARQELATRRDVYGYDVVAWALHKLGRDREAREAIAGALRLGTVDAQLFYHAGVIASAVDDAAGATAYLADALRADPYAPKAQRAVAVALLDSLHAAPRGRLSDVVALAPLVGAPRGDSPGR